MRNLRRLLRLLVVALLAMSAQTLSAQIVQLTEDPEVIYLPDWIQIQASATLADGTTLVVWGSTVSDALGENRPQLVYQMVRNGQLEGDAKVLTRGDAWPSSALSILSLDDRFMVLWNDQRETAPGTYQSIVHSTDGTVEIEQMFDDRELRWIDTVAGLSSESMVLVLGLKGGSSVIQLDRMGQVLGPAVRGEHQPYNDLEFVYRDYVRIVPFTDGSGLPIEFNGSNDVNRVIPSARLQTHLFIDSLDRVWSQEDSVVRLYDDFWSTTVVDSIGLHSADMALPYCLFAGVSDRGAHIFLLASGYENILDLQTDVYRDYYVQLEHYVLGGDSLIRLSDTLRVATMDAYQRPIGVLRPFTTRGYYKVFLPAASTSISVPGVSAFAVHVNRSDPFLEDKRVDRLVSASMYSLDIQLVDKVASRDSVRGPGLVTRVPSLSESSIKLEIGSNVHELSTSASRLHPHYNASDLWLTNRDGQLFTGFVHPVLLRRDGYYTVGQVVTLDSNLTVLHRAFTKDSLPIELPRYDPEPCIGEYQFSRKKFGFYYLNIGGHAFLVSLLWRHDNFTPNHTEQYPSYYQQTFDVFRATDSGYTSAAEPLDHYYETRWFDDLFPFPAPFGIWEPNSRTAFMLLAYRTFAIDEQAQITKDSTPVGSLPRSSWIPLGESEWLVVINSTLIEWRTKDTLALLSNRPASPQYQRLLGPRFLGHGSVAEDYQLQVFDLDGTPISSAVIPDLSPDDLIIGGADSAVILLWSSTGAVRCLTYNQALQASEPEIVVATLPKHMVARGIVGTLLDNRLYVSWIGRDTISGREEVYITSIETPDIPYDSTWNRGTNSVEENPRMVQDLDLSGLWRLQGVRTWSARREGSDVGWSRYK